MQTRYRREQLRPECQREGGGAALPGFGNGGIRGAVVNLHLRPSRLCVLVFLSAIWKSELPQWWSWVIFSYSWNITEDKTITEPSNMSRDKVWKCGHSSLYLILPSLSHRDLYTLIHSAPLLFLHPSRYPAKSGLWLFEKYSEYKWRKRELLNKGRDRTNFTSKLEPVLKGPLTHTLSTESRGCWSGLKTWRQKLSSPVLMGWGLHALVASSLSHEAFPFSEDHMESNRWKKNESSYLGLWEKETEIWPPKNSTHRQGSGMRSLLDV